MRCETLCVRFAVFARRSKSIANHRMRILLIEDDRVIAAFVVKGLKEAGFAVDHAVDGEQGMDLAVTAPYDVMIVDLMLPGRNGFSIIKALRGTGMHTPIIILSARRSVDDRVRGLETGGDDYLVKPFAFTELLARIQALLRRAGNISEPTTLTVGDLTINLVKRKVTRAGGEIELQQREFVLLEYLMRNHGRVVSKTMIMEHVWDYNFDPQTNVVEARICRLRDKIDRNFSTRLIHTIRGAGYILEQRK